MPVAGHQSRTGLRANRDACYRYPVVNVLFPREDRAAFERGGPLPGRLASGGSRGVSFPALRSASVLAT